jgi:hypothetical protein
MIDRERVLAFFDRRRRAYQQVFSRANPADQIVLADYAEFCCVNRSTAVGDNPYKTARLEGRREAFLYLCRALALSPEEQFALVAQKDQP